MSRSRWARGLCRRQRRCTRPPGIRRPTSASSAAEALANIGRTEEALRVLVDELRHETGFIRLRAINVLDRLGEAAQPALRAIQEAAMPGGGHDGEYLDRMTDCVPRKFMPMPGSSL